MKRNRTLFGACLGLLLARSVFAWGPIGRMTIAYVAYQHLTPEIKARVSTLLKLNPDYANWEKQIPAGTSPEEHDRIMFVAAAVWADDIKGESQYSDDGPDPGGNIPGGATSSQNTGYSDLLRHRYWHFVDTPFSPDRSKLPDIPTPNAETQIDAFRAVLSSDQPDALKAYDLVWLIHLIGDIHQPLHAVDRITQDDLQGDAGGNKIKLYGDASTNLHAYWDDLLGSDGQYCAKKIHCEDRAVVVSKTLPVPNGRSVHQMKTSVWIRESFELARTVVYQEPIGEKEATYTIIPWSAYELHAQAVAREQAALAGARLAQVLNQELK